MILHGVLDDGQAQSRTAGGLGVALVHPVEAFKHPGLILRRNADAGVRHLYDRGLFVGVHEEMHTAAGDIVLDGIVTEVVEDFIQKPPHALDGGRLAFHHQRDLFLGGFVLQAVCDLFRQGEQFHLFPGHFVPFVQLGQADNITDQCHHPGGFRANLPDEVGHVLRLHHALFDQLGAAQNALQRRFQLMRHIGGELPAVALGVFLLGNIEGQQHRAHDPAVGVDTAQIELVHSAAPMAANFRVAVGKGLLNGQTDLVVPIHRQEALPHAIFFHAEELHGRSVDAQHVLLFVQQHQPFLHVADDLVELVRALAHDAQLLLNFFVLPVDAVEQRRNFLIALVVQRVLQVQMIERLHDLLGQPPRQQAGQEQRRGQHHQHRLQQSQHQPPRRCPADGNTQHRAVLQPTGKVQGLFHQGGGIAGALPLPQLQGVLNFRAVLVVLHLARIRLRVIKNAAVLPYPCQTVAFRLQAGKVAFSFFLHGGDRQTELVPQLALLQVFKIAVQAIQNNQKAGQQHHARHQQDGAENSFIHTLVPPAGSPRCARSESCRRRGPASAAG